MSWLLIGVLALGLVLGGAGMRALPKMLNRGLLQGTWRPGAGVGGVVAAFAALVMAVRGELLAAAVLAGVAASLLVASRRRAGAATPAQGMSEAEARAVLGVAADADPAAIQGAYLRLMKRVHPDQGGAVGLATQLNAARDVLAKGGKG